jgi:NAD(P)-dependent dehydrogenase (short-subunit alcohol dehydrogenase family)
VTALADAVYERHGACHLLFNNAGVTSGGGGLPWEQEPNDWKWCFNVNVFGVANGILAFVPRMIEGGEEGVIVNTSSGDGGIAPVPYASVYASSKAAISCLTEALAHQLIETGTNLRASVFYPSGGLMDTGLWTASRNRPAELARQKDRGGGPVPTFADFKARLESMGHDVQVADLDDLGRFVLAGIQDGRYVIAHDLDRSAALLHARADAIGRGELPPHHGI